MEINILHLYSDLLNLYGDYANVKVLARHFRDQGFKVNISYLTIGDELDFDKFDFIYIGSGTKINLIVALKHLIKYKDNLLKAVKDNKVFLSTGTSLELFGKSIKELDDTVYPALNIFDFNITKIKEHISNDMVCYCNLINDNVIGAVNKESIMDSNNNPLFDILYGSDNDKNIEGANINNFFATYLIGPVLCKNPSFVKLIMNRILDYKKINFEFKDITYEYEEIIHNHRINEILSRDNK